MQPDGVFLSNGPGDPEPCDYAIEAIREILAAGVPTFGICLGHQLLALASGARTVKMKFGHHGANHPVQDLETGRVMITSQNHGFAVDEASLPDNLQPTHRSLFDNSLQGISRTDCFAIGFQGHPEASPGPRELRSIFSRFTAAMQTAQRAPAIARRSGRWLRIRCRYAQAHRYREHPDHRRRSHCDRPGLRVRLLRGPGLQGAAGGGLPGHPGELQSGHYHDRPGYRRCHLHRTGGLAVGGQHHRARAARCAAAHHGRPDCPELRAGPGARRRPEALQCRVDRCIPGGHRHGRRP